MFWKRISSVVVVLMLLCVTVALQPARPVAAGTLVVTGAGDTVATDGVCTLREAITSANTNAVVDTCGTPSAGADIITFSLSPVAPITLTAGLPDIIETLTINGNSQPGYMGVPLITIDGGGAYRPFRIGTATSAITLTITGLIVQNGKSTSASSGGSSGGAFLVTGGASSGNTLRIQNSVIQNNVAMGNGGAIFNQLLGTTNISQSVVTGNKANTQGGAVQNVGILVIDQSTISNNQTTNATSGNGGGIMLFSGAQPGSATVTNSTVSGNSAKSGGGGFDLENPNTLTITNTTISGNTTTGVGGGIIKNGGTLIITYSTLTNNSASSGGGIESAGGATISNTIDAQNIATTTHPDIEFGGGTMFTSAGHNVIGNSTGSTGWVATDQLGSTATPLLALLAPLGSYGGTTQTQTPLPGSPAIDTGAGCSGTDQRGITRPQGTACDIGAVESQGFTATLPTGNNQSAAVTTAFAAPVGITVSDPNNEPVSGGVITFTIVPGMSGASAAFPGGVTTATGIINGSGLAVSPAFTANSTLGSFTIIATAAGVTPTTTFTETNTPGAAASFTVAGFPSPVIAGTAGTVTVTAKDAFGNTATGYTGTVHFTSSDAAAILPADATLTNGVGTFSATLKTVGTQTITATDTVTGSITGTQTGIIVNPGAAASFTVSGFPSPVVAGTAGTVTVTAKDASGNIATGYTGTVHLTSSDAAAVLPPNATLTNGVGTFAVTLTTSGTQSITATDTVTNSITGAQTGIVVTSGAAASFTVSGFPSPTISGVAGNVTVTAKDAFGNTATGYTGTVHFTSSDPAATLPANGTLTNGVGTFSVSLFNLGTQSITATDTVTAAITGAQTGIIVNGIAPAAVADSYALTTGTTLTVPPATGVLANDTKGTPAATISSSTQPTHGTLTLNPDGSFSYVSTAPFTGTDSFTYTLSNGPGTFGTGSSTATVTLTVNAASVTALTTTAPTGAGSGNGGTASAPVIRVGGSITLSTTGTYNNGTSGSVSPLTYSGYDPNVLSVDANGVVTALAGGTTAVTITAPNGVTTTVTVTVTTATGTGLMAPAPQPAAKPGNAPSLPDATVAPQPTRKADAPPTGGVQPQAVGQPTATPNAQPARR